MVKGGANGKGKVFKSVRREEGQFVDKIK